MDLYRRLGHTEAASWDLYCKYVRHSRKHQKDLKKIVSKKSRSKLKELDRNNFRDFTIDEG